jgi:hypothetical protein
MPGQKVFRTKADYPANFEITGQRRLGAHGRGGLPVKEAAARGMSELSATDENGAHTTDELGNLVPLEGQALVAAAKRYVEAHPELELVELSDEKIAQFPHELGVPVDEYPGAQRKAELEAAAVADAPPANVVPAEVAADKTVVADDHTTGVTPQPEKSAADAAEKAATAAHAPEEGGKG